MFSIIISYTGLFYYTIGNFDPKYRSAVHTIQLVAVVKSSLSTKYGINAILKPFMDDICTLESVRIAIPLEDIFLQAIVL